MRTIAAMYDEVSASYDVDGRGGFGVVYDHVTWAGLAAVLPPAPARVLDVGGGTGRHAFPLARRGYRLTVVDVSRGMLAQARGRAAGVPAPVALAQGGLERLPFREGAFDFVLCEGDPLSYCGAGAAEAARELLRVLVPGGGFYVSCDSRWFGALAFLAMGEADAGLACVATGASCDPYGAPVRAFAPDELTGLFEAAGAADVRVHGKVCLAHFLPDPVLAALLADPRRREALLASEEKLSVDASVAGLASHVVATGRKGTA